MTPRTLLFSLWALAVPCTAQTVVPLDEALATARSESLPVLRAAAQVEAAEASLGAVRDGRWPALSLSLGGGQRYGLTFDQTAGGLTQETVEAVDVGVSGSYVVFDGFERRAATRAAEATLRAAELNGVRAGQEAARTVLAGYLDVAEAEARRAIAAANEEAERQLLAEVEAQVAFGTRPDYEVAQQTERVAAAEGAGLQAERERERAAARLVQILGLDAARAYVFRLPEGPPAEAVPDPDAAVARALAARPDLEAATAAQRAVESDRRAARAGRLPEVAIVGSVGTTFSSANQAVGLPRQLGDNRSGGVGLRVSLPLLDRGSTRARVRQAEARAATLGVEAETVRRTVVYEVTEAVSALRGLAAQARVAAARRQAAEAALDAELARFEAGTTTLQAVAQLRSRAVEARIEAERIRIQQRVQRRVLELALGAVPG